MSFTISTIKSIITKLDHLGQIDPDLDTTYGLSKTEVIGEFCS
jgi:hypothetical protein